jgi:hypothetical protein
MRKIGHFGKIRVLYGLKIETKKTALGKENLRLFLYTFYGRENPLLSSGQYGTLSRR